MKQLIIILNLLIATAVIWFLYLVLNPLVCPVDDANSNVEFCGVESKPETHDKLYQLGKKHFREACVQCHSMNLDQNATGPPLNNAFSRWNNDTLKFTKYLNNSSVFIIENPTNYSWVNEGEYKLNENTHRNAFNEKQIRALIKFLEFESK